MNPDQTAPVGAVWSGFIVFVSMIKSNLKWIWIYAADVTSRYFQDKNIDKIRMKHYESQHSAGYTQSSLIRFYYVYHCNTSFLTSHQDCCSNGWILVYLFLLLYIPSQQLWSWRDGQFTYPHFFLGKLEVLQVHTFAFACNWQQPFLNYSAEGRRMTVEIISWSISTKVWDRAGIKLATPGSAVRHTSVARHITDCAMRPGKWMKTVKS